MVNGTDAAQLWSAAPAGGAIGDGRTGANLALLAAAVGLVLGWWALRTAARGEAARARSLTVAAVVAGVTGVALGVLHVATAADGPGTGNGFAGGIVAVLLGSAAVAVGLRARSRAALTAREG
ncbi:DUF6223 family protein [Streptomyces sp. NPDC002734]|uniref:DUF6223 family protein n=1 Tax=Streptomyces sp. NPDC002734 TaxID=3154426 RepID=UPI003329D742